MKINRNEEGYENEECWAVDLRYGDVIPIPEKANLRLLNCSLDVNGFVVN